MCLETQTLSKTGWDRIRTGNHSSRIGTGTHQDWDHCTGTGHFILSHGCTVVYSGVQSCTVVYSLYSRVQSCTVLSQAILGYSLSCPGNSGCTVLSRQFWAYTYNSGCTALTSLGNSGRTVLSCPGNSGHTAYS